MCSKRFFPRGVVAQNIGDDCGRLGRKDLADGVMLSGHKFRACRYPAPRETCIGGGKIAQPYLGVAEDESGTVVVQRSTELKPPLLQFEKCRTRSQLAEREDRR